jgi:hypothetical protein
MLRYTLALLALAVSLNLSACETGDDIPWMSLDSGADAISGHDVRDTLLNRRDTPFNPDVPWDFGQDHSAAEDADHQDSGWFDADPDALPWDVYTPDIDLDVSSDITLDTKIDADADKDADADADADVDVDAEIPTDIKQDSDSRDVPRDTSPDGTDGLSCMEVATCAMDCGGDYICMDDCYAQGSPAAQEQAELLLWCAEDNCADLFHDSNALLNCVIQYCPNETMACIE